MRKHDRITRKGNQYVLLILEKSRESMRKAQKKQIEGFIELLEQAHEEIRKLLEAKNDAAAMNLLGQCQEGAVKVGELIERTEGENIETIPRLEEYCEVIYQVYDVLERKQEINVNKTCKKLKRSLIQVENSIRNDICVRLEVVFFPYKASMWDSFESIWHAADADPDCTARVVPIPYYDKKQDGSFGTYHYEGDMFPSDVPVLHYDTYCLEEQQPDIVFIHNPYDHINRVTSVEPRFYSHELKKYTECLVYIPYYTTSGGMCEGQGFCPAYYFADYIIIQAEKYRRFFDPELPEEKFVPLGSPKFDRVVRLCGSSKEPPAEWKTEMEGRKVYFYNTSINGMLADTDAFLKKMMYVFEIFRGRKKDCLLWRPHPLLESTFDTMRASYKPVYCALKRFFVDEHIGILDETADIEKSIALSDVYIGDAGTSVTSLFGVAGKPVFILNNYINTLPEENDWRGEKANLSFDIWESSRYQIVSSDQLWFSENDDFHYRFCMSLESGYSGGGYYLGAAEIRGKIYVFPGNAQHMLVIRDKKIKKIPLKKMIMHAGAFSGYIYTDRYIFLFPYQYPFLVRFNIDTEEISYVAEAWSFNVRNIEGEWRAGGAGLVGNEIILSSPEDNHFMFLNIDSLETRELCSHSKYNSGTLAIIPNGNDLWLLPYCGMTIVCWNPEKGDVREYNEIPQNFQSIRQPYGCECNEKPFGNIVFSGNDSQEKIIVSPYWGNMYLALNRETGRMEEWKPPVDFMSQGKNGYFLTEGMGGFIFTYSRTGKAVQRIWYAPERKLYDVNIDTGEYREIEVEFDYDDLIEHEPGFSEESEWMQYGLKESAFNSLKDLLDDHITGNSFDQERQYLSLIHI